MHDRVSHAPKGVCQTAVEGPPLERRDIAVRATDRSIATHPMMLQKTGKLYIGPPTTRSKRPILILRLNDDKPLADDTTWRCSQIESKTDRRSVLYEVGKIRDLHIHGTPLNGCA